MLIGSNNKLNNRILFLLLPRLILNKSLQRALVVFIVCVLICVGFVAASMQNSVFLLGFPGIAVCVAFAFVIQWLVYIPSFIKQTERYYDLTGSGTFVVVTCIALFAAYQYPPIIYGQSALSWYKIMLGAMVIIWALRLGIFLFSRIHQDGKDDRFDSIKPDMYRFWVTWTIQGLWVILSAGAALTAILSTQNPSIGIVAIIGLCIWAFGFAIEVIADRQKRAFKRRSERYQGLPFITTGLWAYSRHPNYFGEIMLWFGVAIAALPALSGWQYVALVSPIFVTVLLVKISGVPLLEAKADKKWSNLAEYEGYKKNTPVLIPFL